MTARYTSTTEVLDLKMTSNKTKQALKSAKPTKNQDILDFNLPPKQMFFFEEPGKICIYEVASFLDLERSCKLIQF